MEMISVYTCKDALEQVARKVGVWKMATSKSGLTGCNGKLVLYLEPPDDKCRKDTEEEFLAGLEELIGCSNRFIIHMPSEDWSNFDVHEFYWCGEWLDDVD